MGMFSSWTVPSDPPETSLGWDNVWVGTKLVHGLTRTNVNPPTHTLKQGWPHEHRMNIILRVRVLNDKLYTGHLKGLKFSQENICAEIKHANLFWMFSCSDVWLTGFWQRVVWFERTVVLGETDTC